MKVCFISRSAYPLFNKNCHAVFGGAEVDTYLVGKELSLDQNYEVSFIVGDFEQSPIEKFGPILLYKSYKFSEPKVLQMLKLVYKIFYVKADVYIQESASGGTGIIALACRMLRKKFIYRTASEIDCNGKFISSHCVEGSLFKLGLKLADVVIVQNSENQRQLLESANVTSRIIKNAITIPQANNFDFQKHVLWVARSEKLKQPFAFLELAGAFPQTKFVMVCPRANFNSVDIEALERSASRLPNLTLLGYVPFSEIWDVFKSASIFVNTSTYEGFPNTFVQATSSGNALLSLNVNPDHFITQHRCGFVAKGDIETLKQQLRLLLADPGLLRTTRERAYLYALKNHDIRRVIGNYKQLLTEVVS